MPETVAETIRETKREARHQGPVKLGERISAIEQRLENRRLRFREDTEEAKVAASVTARKWLPVAAAAGAGLAALWLLNRRRSGEQRRIVYEPRVVDEDYGKRRGVRWASLLGIASTAYKFGTSPQGRVLIATLRDRFGRGRATRYG
jgi:hypothetical protein